MRTGGPPFTDRVPTSTQILNIAAGVMDESLPMRWSIRIARVAGTDIKVHLTFLLLLAWIGYSYHQQGGMEAAVEGIVFILLLFGCVVLHELGHATAARLFGIKTPDITLLPIGGVARLQRMPEKPWQELVVALAGPAVNVVIAAVLIFALRFQTDLGNIGRIEDPGVPMTAKLAAVNIILVLFNMIPAFPMDGGRVLRALLAMAIGQAAGTRIASSIGQGLAFLFGFLGLLYNPLLIFIALLVYLGASHEAALAQLKEVTRGVRVADAMVTRFTSLRPRDTLERAVDALLHTTQHEFPILDEVGRLVALLTRDDLIRGLRERGPDSPAIQSAHRDLPVVSPHDSFDEAFLTMQESTCPALPVVDSAGRLLGLLTPETVGEMMMIQSALPKGASPAWWRDHLKQPRAT